MTTSQWSTGQAYSKGKALRNQYVLHMHFRTQTPPLITKPICCSHGELQRVCVANWTDEQGNKLKDMNQTLWHWEDSCYSNNKHLMLGRFSSKIKHSRLWKTFLFNCTSHILTFIDQSKQHCSWKLVCFCQALFFLMSWRWSLCIPLWKHYPDCESRSDLCGILKMHLEFCRQVKMHNIFAHDQMYHSCQIWYKTPLPLSLN